MEKKGQNHTFRKIALKIDLETLSFQFRSCESIFFHIFDFFENLVDGGGGVCWGDMGGRPFKAKQCKIVVKQGKNTRTSTQKYPNPAMVGS